MFQGLSCQVLQYLTFHIFSPPPPPHGNLVLAYGATGAGKTHTMLGSPEDPGVMYLTMAELYNSMDQMKEEKHCAIAVSYLEVNEHMDFEQ